MLCLSPAYSKAIKPIKPLVFGDVINTLIANGMSYTAIGTWRNDFWFSIFGFWGVNYCVLYATFKPKADIFATDYKECLAGVYYHWYVKK